MRHDASTIDHEFLLAHVLRRPREWTISHPETKLHPSQRNRLDALLRRRTRGEPLAYLLGEQWFYGRPFNVNRDVLIPRPESELLIELAIEHVRAYRIPSTEYRILDLGTGSGCIAVTLAAELPDARVIAIDVSTTAPRVARANARRHGVANRITFLQGNLLEPFLKSLLRERTDGSRTERGNPVTRAPRPGLLRLRARNDIEFVMLANLPYLTTAEWRALPRSVRAHEPRQALDGGPDGLTHYRELCEQLAELHARSYTLRTFLEIDPRRKRALAALTRKHLPEWEVSWHRDLAGRWRVLALTAQGRS